MNKTLVEEYCQARLMTCCKLILYLKPTKQENDDLTAEIVASICDSVITVMDNTLDKGLVVASLLNEPLFAQNQRAQVSLILFLSNFEFVLSTKST